MIKGPLFMLPIRVRAEVELATPLQHQEASGAGIRVERYKRSRYWAVWIDDRLLAVTVYKKGAVAIRETLLQTSAE